MGLWLRQSTVVSVKIGPFIDDTDGKTAETGLTLSQGDVKLSKNGGDLAQKNDAGAATTDEMGYYDCPLNTTDTNTLGTLQLVVHESGALPVFHEFMVMPANVYNSLVLGSASDYLDVAVVEQANIDFGATQKASIETAVDAAFENDIPAVPTAGSINDVLNDLDGKFPTNKIMGSSDVDNHDTDIDSILADSNELQTDWANGGRLDLLIDGIKAITDLLTLAAIADAVHDEAVEGAITGRQATRLILAALTGITSEAVAGTMVIRDANDTADRITATMDANRYRTGVVLNP